MVIANHYLARYMIMILTYFLLITSQLTINCNCLKSFTLEPPEKESFRLRAGSFTVVSSDHQVVSDWVIKAGRLLLPKSTKYCLRGDSTSGRSLVMIADKNHGNGTCTIHNACTWNGKVSNQRTSSSFNTQCLGVRKSTLGAVPMYLIWNAKYRARGECKYFHITAAYKNEQDMFNIFYQQGADFYSPSCCVIAYDNVNIPIVDSGLSMCKCGEQDINIIENKPVLKKGLLGYFKKIFH